MSDKAIKMFVCGPTVYDYMHIGNARTFVVFDAYAKWLRHTGVDLEYIQNITDIDDKIIARAEEQNRQPAEFAKEWEEKFYEDAKALGITSPVYKRAMDHVPEIKSQVQRLLDSKHAYTLEDGIYFDLASFSDYGKLSGRTELKGDDAVSRIDENPNKRNKGDFCIWKFQKPFRSSPSIEGKVGWGSVPGRPGWHIEDTAITEKYFGPQYNIHGGGIDLIFPHHEAEIAIMESLSGQKPFVKKWMHAGFVIVKRSDRSSGTSGATAKMSKSAGNFTTLREALKHHSPEALRFYFLSAHYKSPLDYSQENIKSSEAAIARLGEFTEKINRFEDEMLPDLNPAIATIIKQGEQAFEESMDDDFNTPKAFAVLFDLMKEINPLLTKRKFDQPNAKILLDFFESVNNILGIIPKELPKLPKTLEMILDQRERARGDKNYELADKLRKQIEEQGYKVDDTEYGPLVKKN